MRRRRSRGNRRDFIVPMLESAQWHPRREQRRRRLSTQTMTQAYSRKEALRLAGVSERQLRSWERQKLIAPRPSATGSASCWRCACSPSFARRVSRRPKCAARCTRSRGNSKASSILSPNCRFTPKASGSAWKSTAATWRPNPASCCSISAPAKSAASWSSSLARIPAPMPNAASKPSAGSSEDWSSNRRAVRWNKSWKRI